jgi:cation-transporting ATPase 13A3/4/5
VVKLYQNLGKVVGMCGDGANDCAALHQANLGLSLSDTETSIAAAFTSKNRHIGSMVELIKESRAGLATNFSLFNVMAAYALTQYTTSIIEQYFYSYPSDVQFVYWDLFLNVMFVFSLGNISTVKNLTIERPSSSLLSIGNVIELLSYYILQLSGHILTILAVNGPFSDNINYFSVGGESFNLKHFWEEGGDDFIFDSPENNCLFVVSNFYYLASVLAFTITKPWKEPVYTFWPFVLCFIFNLAYSICIAIVPQLRFSEFALRHLVDS